MCVCIFSSEQKSSPSATIYKRKNTAHFCGKLSGLLHHFFILVSHLSYLSYLAIINIPSKKIHLYFLDIFEMFDMYDQMRLQPELSCFFFTIGFIFFWRTILIASSKTPLSPYWVRALHSMYLHLNSSSITFLAVSLRIGASLGSFFITEYSSRRSILLPTKILGTLPTFSWSSGYHWVTEGVLSFERWRRMMAR